MKKLSESPASASLCPHPYLNCRMFNRSVLSDEWFSTVSFLNKHCWYQIFISLMELTQALWVTLRLWAWMSGCGCWCGCGCVCVLFWLYWISSNLSFKGGHRKALVAHCRQLCSFNRGCNSQSMSRLWKLKNHEQRVSYCLKDWKELRPQSRSSSLEINF